MRKSVLTAFTSFCAFLLAAVVVDPAKHFINDQIKEAHLLETPWALMKAHPGWVGLGVIISGLLTVWAWLGEDPDVARGTLPEFTMVRLDPSNQHQDNKSWNEVVAFDDPASGDCEFERNREVAADPVFDITVKNTSSKTLELYRVGIRILQRKTGQGGMFGGPRYSGGLGVQSDLTICCPEEWKKIRGRIDDCRFTEVKNPPHGAG